MCVFTTELIKQSIINGHVIVIFMFDYVGTN